MGSTTIDDTSKPLILVVDDFLDSREMYGTYLEFAGYRVALAADGHDALAKAFELLPDAVLLDMSLPGIDGWEVTRRLKQADATREIPVIAVSGHALREHSDNAKVCGADVFVAKPCLPEVVTDEIRRALTKSKTTFKLPR